MAVVRCTGCRGAAQVGPEAVGLLVVCPRCQEPFLAIEEAAIAPERSEAVRERRRPRREPRRPRRDIAEPVHPADSHDPHDPPIVSSSRLPASVLIGFALLPFAIPLLWLIGPFVAQPPALSLAAPASLALAASVLCLAVVFTVDWTPATRIKGVLMLVGLSYFAGLSLYFVKKELIDRAKNFFAPSTEWHEFHPLKSDYTVLLPNRLPPDAPPSAKQPLAGWKLRSFELHYTPLQAPHVMLMVGSGVDRRPDAADWYDEVEKALKRAAPADAEFKPPAGVQTDHELDGREWIVELPGIKATRIVRVYRANGNIYYLAVEGERGEIAPDDAPVQQFLRSLEVRKPAGP